MNWRLSARCRGTDTDLFFQQGNRAKSVIQGFCNHCPVAVECLIDALKEEDDGTEALQRAQGIRGGLTAPRRRSIIRRRREEGCRR